MLCSFAKLTKSFMGLSILLSASFNCSGASLDIIIFSMPDKNGWWPRIWVGHSNKSITAETDRFPINLKPHEQKQIHPQTDSSK